MSCVPSPSPHHSPKLSQLSYRCPCLRSEPAHAAPLSHVTPAPEESILMSVVPHHAACLHRLALCLAGAISSFTPCLHPGHTHPSHHVIRPPSSSHACYLCPAVPYLVSRPHQRHPQRLPSALVLTSCQLAYAHQYMCTLAMEMKSHWLTSRLRRIKAFRLTRPANTHSHQPTKRPSPTCPSASHHTLCPAARPFSSMMHVTWLMLHISQSSARSHCPTAPKGPVNCYLVLPLFLSHP